MKISTDYDVQPHNSFGLSCKVSYYVEAESEKDVKLLLKDEFFHMADKQIIGGGSNLLFTSDYKGVVLHYVADKISYQELDNEEVLLTLDAGVLWDDAVAFACQHGWWGIENLSNIPGESGAAAVQNIGAYGVEIADCIETVQGYNFTSGAHESYSQKEAAYSYRQSLFKTEAMMDHFLVTSVSLRLSKKPNPKLSYKGLEELEKCSSLTPQRVRDEIIKIRAQKLPDPDKIGNAGSFFMNPIVSEQEFKKLFEKYPQLVHYKLANGDVKLSAAWLIEQAGMKGYSVGNAECYKKHALILVNRGGASPKDVVLLARAIRQKVKETFGVRLMPEVKFINYDFNNDVLTENEDRK